MKKLKVFLSILVFILIPTITFASSSDGTESFPIGVAILMEAFVSIHMSIFVLFPLSKMLSKEGESKKLFLTLFIIRAVILLFCDFFVTRFIAVIDFVAVFIGTFIVVPLVAIIKGKKFSSNIISVNKTVTTTTTFLNSNGEIQKIQEVQSPQESQNIPENDRDVNDTSPVILIDPEYLNKESVLIRNIIKSEIESQGEDPKILTTNELNSRKNILILIFGLVTCLFVVMYFFNIPFGFCISLEIVAIIIYKLLARRFDVINAISRYAKKNPDKEIFQIVSSIRDRKKYGTLPNFVKIVTVVSVAIIIPIIMFSEPKLVYSRCKDGYSVLRYTRGFKPQDENIVIPDEYKGKPVVEISRSAFATTPVKNVILPKSLKSINYKAFYKCELLESIIIPENVTEIRGSAFEGCLNLISVSLPKNLKEIRGSAFRFDEKLYDISLPKGLEYLGAGAFANCSSIVEITIPPKVTEINGETFIYCTSLEKINFHEGITSIHGETFIGDISLNNVKLPSKITEIRGNTFEGCRSLTSIVIPEGVTRIGGHAFYGCRNLAYVYVPSSVKEIGSSAFRLCTSLYTIDLPDGVQIDERSFKESPTDINYY